MRNLHRALLAGSLSCSVALVAGCGSGAGLLSGGQASTLQNQLNQISSAFSAGRCGAVRSGTQSLASDVASLPTSVAEKLRQALDAEASQVSTLAVQQCHPVTNTPTTTTTTPTTTATTTTPTTTSNTTTTTTPTTNTSPTTTTPATTTTTPGSNSGSSGGGGLTGGAGAGGANNGSGNSSGNSNG